jgi:uncharacterized repeat protein (TIGR01451 family)
VRLCPIYDSLEGCFAIVKGLVVGGARHLPEPDWRRVRPFVLSCLVGLLVLLLPTMVAAQPTGYQEYYVLGYEEHIWDVYLSIYEGPDTDIPGRICSTVSLVATADHQVVYYDHWEDGYEADLLNPIQPTTEVYGDGNPLNGGTGQDILSAGDAVNLVSDQDRTGRTEINGYVPVDPARNPADIRYDGGDRLISSGGPVDLTHAMWPLGRSWIGGAWEVYSRQAYAEAYSYRLPIGEDLYQFGGGDVGSYGDFRNVYLQLSAFEDNTTVSIENGTVVVNLTLDRGATYSSMGYINSDPAPAMTINAGTRIRSNKPTQVGLATGADSRGGDGFQGRFLIVLSDQMWGADYVVPVPSGGPGHEAEIYLANPNDFPITINAYDAEVQTSFVISPSNYISGTVPYSTKRGGLGRVPQDSAARFTSSDGVFGVVVAADSSNITYDWGFAGIPATYLTSDYYVSWAPGTTDLSNNGSPIWVTPLADGTTFYVDYSPLDGVVDETFTLDVLQQRRIYDPDDDNTGTHIWATSEFAMAWGEDPRRAGPSSPYLDLGVTTLPLLQRWLDPVLTMDKTVSPTILPSAGGTVTFTLVAQCYNSPLTNVDVTDTLPLNWSYVPNSTHVTYPDGRTANPEPTRDGQTLYWDLSTALDVNQQLKLTFQAEIVHTGGVDRAVYDGFESNTYSGGANWASGWQEQGDDGLPGSGDVRIVTGNAPFAGERHLQLRAAGNSIARTVDLGSFVLPTLHFVRRVEELESEDVFYLDVFNGRSWTNVLSWADEDLEGEYVHEIVDLTPFAGAASAIRFRSGNRVDGTDFLYVDQVEVYEGISVSVNRAEAMGTDEYSSTMFGPTDEATVYISPLGLKKSVSATQARIGDTLVYTLSYANTSTNLPATNVTLRDAVPIQSVTFQSASDGGVFDAASGSIIWTLGTLAPGDRGMVSFTATVNKFVEDGTILKNVAYLKSDQTRAGSNEVRTTVLAPRVRFSKAGPDAAARGQVITYTLSYRNGGGSKAAGAVISDRIPSLTSYVPGSLAINTGDGWARLSDAIDSDQGAWVGSSIVVAPGLDPGTLAPGEAGQIRFNVRIDADLPPSSLILNSATLDRDWDIPRESNTVVTRISDLLLTKEAQQTAVAPGDAISYTLMYENISGAMTQADVYVLEPIPSFTRFIPGTAYGGDLIEYSADNGVTWSMTVPGVPVTHIRWYDAVLPARERDPVGFAVRVNSTLPPNTTIRNIARITSTETSLYFHEWIPSNEVRVETVDLWVEKRVSHALALAGAPISYTLLYGNHGSADVSRVRLEDTLPADTTYRPGSISGAGADDSGAPTLAWEVGTVRAGASARVAGYSVWLNLDLLPTSVVTNVATLSSPYGLEPSDPVTTIVDVPPDPILELDKEANYEIVAPGQQFTYTLTVVNRGRPVHGVEISDVVPADTSFVRCGGTACGLAGDTVVWGPIAALEPGGTLDLTLVVAVDESLPNGWPIVNADYRLVADDAPTIIGQAVTTTVGVPDLSLTKWAVREEVFAGSRLQYGILVRNRGGLARNLVVSDTLPAHTTFSDCDGSYAVLAHGLELQRQGQRTSGAAFTCGLEGDTVVWRVDDLADGRSLQMTLGVTVDAGLSEGALIVNDSYAVAADYTPMVRGNVPVTTTVRRLNVSISKVAWPDPVTVTEQLYFTLTVENRGSLLRELLVTDVLPSGVSFVGCGGALCDFVGGSRPWVKWWLPELPENSKRELSVRIFPGFLRGDTFVNALYGVWIPAAGRRVVGEPVAVGLINPYPYHIFLPVAFRDWP